MFENFKILPIGSVVSVKGSKEPFMIVSQFPVTNSNNREGYFDFGAVQLPLGLISDEMIFFNKEDISSILFIGYLDERFQELQEKYDELTDSIVHEHLKNDGGSDVRSQ